VTTNARVAVIGGGVVGASVLYHLARAGWRDVVLLERDELTSGSTWHAAGGMHTHNSDPNVAKLQRYTIELYREIEEASGQSCGVHITGGIHLAGTPARMDFLKVAMARGRLLGLDMELIDAHEAARRFPLMDPQHFLGALYAPLEGHVDPYGVTHAYVKAARALGATVHRHTRVTSLARQGDEWRIATTQGDIAAEHVVNAGGLWAREVGRMVGLELPLLAMEHQYLVTEEVPEVVASPSEVLHVIDFEGEIYMRQEGRGMLIGTYERAGVPWSERETPWDFTHALLPPDLDRIAGSLEVGFAHFPPLARAGIKRVVNGPFTFAPDGNPLVGPVRGVPNYWVACAVMAGFSQGGGVGLALANWMTSGDPGFDVYAMDVARFGAWATPLYTRAKVTENYARRFRIRFPNEELPAGRPLATGPVHDALAARNAVFGAAFGVEHALWFAPPGAPAEEVPTYRRSNAHDPVGAECRAVRDAVGLYEATTFARYAIEGRGASAWIDRLFAVGPPREGRIVLAPLLGENGKLAGDFTLANLGNDRFLLFGSGVAEEIHLRAFDRHLPAPGMTLRSLRAELAGLAIAGPRARDVLSRLCAEDVDSSAMPFLAARPLRIAGAPVTAIRISFTGELGYELWMPTAHQRAVFEALVDAGTPLGLRLFGARALNALRLEKSFGTWAREYRPIYDPIEAGLERRIDWRKPAFVGRAAALRAREAGPQRQLVTLVVDAEAADAIGDEPVWHDGRVVGAVTSGGYGHRVGRSIALAYVPAALAGATRGFAVEILGDRRAAERVAEPLYDASGSRMRLS
jgi:dimethylglycine dehydrogenase